MNKKNIERITLKLLTEIGENPKRDGLIETPTRVASFYKDVLSGYNEAFKNHAVTFANDLGESLVLINDIEFYSVCEHHLVPFFGSVCIGYIPNKKILGLSKFIRVAEVFSKRLQVQERLNSEIIDSLDKILEPKGIAVRIEARHLCISMRGIKNQNAVVVTQRFKGLLDTNKKYRQEFFDSLK